MAESRKREKENCQFTFFLLEYLKFRHFKDLSIWHLLKLLVFILAEFDLYSIGHNNKPNHPFSETSKTGIVSSSSSTGSGVLEPACDSYNSHFRPRDVRNVLKNSIKKSAPGPDGVSYSALFKLESTHHIQATLFTKVLSMGRTEAGRIFPMHYY